MFKARASKKAVFHQEPSEGKADEIDGAFKLYSEKSVLRRGALGMVEGIEKAGPIG